jgi:hypothetical protein
VATFDDFGKPIGNELKRVFAQFEERILQSFICLLIEASNIAGAWLDLLPTEMQLSKIKK